ncbi:MAG TPA: DUF6263 family protein [Planctomycetota bacterium]|jgi:uncharacterized protein DUF6263|nr:DUF6263 family protein [Planctomycetota bacterium]
MRFIALSLAFLLSIAASGPAQDGDKINLEWKFKKGDSNRYELNQSTEMDIAGMEINQEMLFGLVWEIVDVNADGVGTVKTTYDRIKVKMAGPMTADYDSDKDKKPADDQMLSRVMSSFLGKSITLQVGRKGEVLKVEGMTKLVESAVADLPDEMQPTATMMKMYINDENTKNQMQALFGMLPKDPIAKGDTWETKSNIALGGLGKSEMKSKCTLKDIREGGKEAVIGIDSKLNFKPEDGGGGMGLELTDSKSKFEMVWSVEKGMLLGMKGTMTLDGSAGGGEMSMVQKTELKLAPRLKDVVTGPTKETPPKEAPPKEAPPKEPK